LFATKSYPNTPFFIRDSITPDGKNLLFSYNRKSAPMGILSLADGRVMWKSKYWANTQDAWQPLSSDGSMFLALRSDTPKRELWLFDTRSGKPVRRVSKPISGNESLERYGFVSGTDRILYIHWSNAAGTSLWSLDTLGKTPKLLTRLQSGIVHISPDGKMLAFDQEPVTKPKNKQITPGFIGLLNNNGHSLRQLRTLVKDEDALFPRWSPDSRYLAVPILPHKRKIPFMKKSDTSYQVEVYDVTTSSLAGLVRVRKQDVYVLDWYPDSKSLACISENDKEYIVYKLQVKQ
jgi:Tol biopolymer transport system component